MDKWNPWKVTALAMALVMATALVTGLVVANWSSSNQEGAQPTSSPANARLIQQPKTTSVRPATSPTQAAPTQAAPAVPAVPTHEVVDACNRYAAAQVGESDKTKEVVKDAAIGAVVGAAVGAAGGAIAGGGKGAGKGAAIGGVVGAGGGTLYGLNENKKNDEKYKAAYSSCMHSRGYTG
jgi:outer membrane protein with glycine zipper